MQPMTQTNAVATSEIEKRNRESGTTNPHMANRKIKQISRQCPDSCRFAQTLYQLRSFGNRIVPTRLVRRFWAGRCRAECLKASLFFVIKAPLRFELKSVPHNKARPADDPVNVPRKLATLRRCPPNHNQISSHATSSSLR